MILNNVTEHFLHLVIQSALVKNKSRMRENSVHIAFDRAFNSLQNHIFVLFLYIIVVTSYIPSISSFVLMLCLITYMFSSLEGSGTFDVFLALSIWIMHVLSRIF